MIAAGFWARPRWASLSLVRRACFRHNCSRHPQAMRFRDAQRAQGRGRSVRGNCGPAHESSGARTGPRSGLPHQRAEADDALKVLVFKSADPDYFISHVDVTRIKEYREEAAKLTGEASIALLFRHLSASRLVTIAQIEGRVRAPAASSCWRATCDLPREESAIFGQPEPGLGVIPGGGGVQHLVRLMGRARRSRSC